MNRNGSCLLGLEKTERGIGKPRLHAHARDQSAAEQLKELSPPTPVCGFSESLLRHCKKTRLEQWVKGRGNIQNVNNGSNNINSTHEIADDV